MTFRNEKKRGKGDGFRGKVRELGVGVESEIIGFSSFKCEDFIEILSGLIVSLLLRLGEEHKALT